MVPTDKGRRAIIAGALRTRQADPGGDTSTKRLRRDRQTLAMVQGATRHFEQIQQKMGNPLRICLSHNFNASWHYGKTYGERN